MRWIVCFYGLIGRDPHHLGKNKDIDLQSIVDVDFPIDAVIDYRKVVSIRDQAAACQCQPRRGVAYTWNSRTPASLAGKPRGLYARLPATGEGEGGKRLV